MPDSDKEQTKLGIESLNACFGQLGDDSVYTRIVWEEFFKALYEAATQTVPVSGEEGSQRDQGSPSVPDVGPGSSDENSEFGSLEPTT